jgi:prevent-host-death family protein
MTNSWKITEARNKLGQVVDEAIHRGPQIITRRGVEVVIVLSLDVHRRLSTFNEKLSDFIRRSPLAEVDIALSRVR